MSQISAEFFKNRKWKAKRTFTPDPVRFYPHSREYNIIVIIIYQPVLEYNGYNNKSAYAMHKRF